MSTQLPEEQLFQDLVLKTKKMRPVIHLPRISRAFRFAQKAHDGQFRMSGEPYICHPVETAKILSELKVDEDTLVAALLHDVPEDTKYTIEDIENRFGKSVAHLVSALTKLSKVHYRHSMDERQVDNLRKMFLETAQDVRVVIIKLADRLHNLRTIRYLRPDKQQRIAKETMEIFAPLANLYGIFKLRQELEDSCFAILQPEESAHIQSFLEEQGRARKELIGSMRVALKKALKKAGINAQLEGRTKHLYSIYQKTVRRKKSLSEIYDYFAIRVIVQSVDDCYRALGVVHTTYRPKPGRFKDYISFPKPNGYQSLHTTVIGAHGNLTEVQLRTEDMHEEAELGAACHLLYKGWRGNFMGEIVDKLKKYRHPETFIKHLQEDLLQTRVYVFSEDGEIVHLPVGATCLDFIYAMELPIDRHILKPVVNGKVYSLFGELQSGDYIQILEGAKKQDGPERIWLEHVKTTNAKEKILEYFKRQSPKTKVGIGARLLQKQLDYENLGLIYSLEKSRMHTVIQKYKLNDFEDLLEKIGEGVLSTHDVYHSMFPEVQMGFFSLFRHAYHLLRRALRLDSLDEMKYRIHLLVEAYDRVGLMKDLLQPFYELEIPIIRIRGTGHDVQTERVVESSYISRIRLDVNVTSHEQLIALFDRLEKTPGAISIKRLFRRSQASFIFLSIATTIYFVAHPFAIQALVNTGSSHPWEDIMIYGGLLGLFALMMWVRTLGNRTFPHFEETRFFWPISFFLSFLAITVLFWDNAVFNLGLDWPVMLIFSIFILGFVYFSYLSHLRRRWRHLNHIKKTELR